MELLAKAAFGVYTLMILLGGIVAATSTSLVRALLGLILTLFGVAGMYLLLAAPFMAFMQILIYLGAVVVLIFFAVMLTRAPAGGEECDPRSGGRTALALLAGLLPALPLGWAVWKGMSTVGPVVPTEVSLNVLGQSFLGPYGLAFELISVVLFVAMAGAVLLGWEKRRGVK
jgi:NADH-quinone oxidoreductase subunit J